MPRNCTQRARGVLRGFMCWLLFSIAIAFASGCSVHVSQDEERELGAYQAAYIDSVAPLINDSVVTDYIMKLGNRMTSKSSRPDLSWRYRVVNISQVNAMALPGGFVYVTRSLIEQADRMDQVAGVMGHEIGHVDRRHSVHQLENAGKRDLAILMLCTLTNACRSLGGRVALQVGADAAAAQYSQHDEAEADSMAVVLTVRAGIDPEGMPTFFEKLLAQRNEDPTPVQAFFASHPTDESRIAAVHREIARMGPSTEHLQRDEPEFHEIQARLRAMPPPPKAADTPQ